MTPAVRYRIRRPTVLPDALEFVSRQDFRRTGYYHDGRRGRTIRPLSHLPAIVGCRRSTTWWSKAGGTPVMGTALVGAATLDELPTQLGVPIDVLVEQVPEPPGPAGITGLRAERAQPHEVPLLHLDPVVV